MGLAHDKVESCELGVFQDDPSVILKDTHIIYFTTAVLLRAENIYYCNRVCIYIYTYT